MHYWVTTLKFIFPVLLSSILNVSPICVAAEKSANIDISIKKVRDDIEHSTHELNQMREKVTAARIPLSKEIRELENLSLIHI